MEEVEAPLGRELNVAVPPPLVTLLPAKVANCARVADTAEEEEDPPVGRVVAEEEVVEDVMGEAAMALERTVRSEVEMEEVRGGDPAVEVRAVSMDETAVSELDARLAAAAARVVSLALDAAKAEEAEEERVTRALDACCSVLDVNVVPPLLPLLLLVLLNPAVKLCASAL